MTDYIRVAGYAYPIASGPEGVSWKFDPNAIDTSSGEPIVRTATGYWVWGRGCTQPGGGIVPHWGFVRTQTTQTGAGAAQTPPAGLGASSSSSGFVPGLLIGGALLGAIAVAFHLATKERAKSVDDEAKDLFPGPIGHGSTPARKILAYKARAARCFYVELREKYSPDVAARIAQRAVAKDRGWLGGLARAGAPVSAGCDQLRSHTPMSYRA